MHVRITGKDTKIETVVDDLTGVDRYHISLPSVHIEEVTGLPGRLIFDGFVDVFSKVEITPISLAIISRLLLKTFTGDFTWDFYGTCVLHANSVRADLESGIGMSVVVK